MSRVNVTINEIPYQGSVQLTGVAGDATNDHQMDNDGNTLLMIENTDAASITATIVSVDDPYGRSEDIALTVAQNELYAAGPFIPSIWNQPGRVMFIDLSAAVTVTLWAIRFNPRR